MPTKEELLLNQTFKDDGIDLGRRVFYTLTQHGKAINEPSAATEWMTAKLVSLLVVKLVESGKLSDSELDEMLLQVVM